MRAAQARLKMTARDEEAYEALASVADPDFEDFFRIYSESIQPREQKPRHLISRLIGSGDYRVLLQKQGGEVVGFGIVFAPQTEAFRLLEYMAVDAGHRNSGFGQRLFQRVVQESVSIRGEPLPLLVEVDSDREASTDRAMRKRRLQFYRRLGCLRVEGRPYTPPSPGEGPLPEMDLLVHLPAGFPGLRKAQLRHWLGIIYECVYDCRRDDDRIAQMMETVADPLSLL